jgi:hypothetical protein
MVCRLVRDDNHPYLAYSPEISMENSSEPFRAFIGAILSVVKGVPVDPSAYSSDTELDAIEGNGVEDGSAPKDANGHGCQSSSGSGDTTNRPAIHSCAHGGKSSKFELNVRQISVIAQLAYMLFRSLRPPRIRPKIFRYGRISIASRPTRLSSRSALGATNNVYGLPNL